jgi:type II secretory pathway component HofQ
MKASGFGGGNANKNDDAEENQEKDWKAFFEQMGVKWPEGSSIMYIKTLGKLYVRNTRENLAEFEKVLQEMGSQPKLIEIETRFVEVAQEDLNSLGFEWILNNDYSLASGHGIGKLFGVRSTTKSTAKYGQTSTEMYYPTPDGTSAKNSLGQVVAVSELNKMGFVQNANGNWERHLLLALRTVPSIRLVKIPTIQPATVTFPRSATTFRANRPRRTISSCV